MDLRRVDGIGGDRIGFLVAFSSHLSNDENQPGEEEFLPWLLMRCAHRR